jgi:hypothetical protein
MKLHSIGLIGIIGFSLMAFTFHTVSTNQLILTGGNSRVWNLTHSLANDYETNVKSLACQTKKIRLKFDNQGFVAQDTSCNGNGIFVTPIGYTITNDSLSFADLSYKIQNISDTKLILVKTKYTTIYNEAQQPTDTVLVTYKLLFDAE